MYESLDGPIFYIFSLESVECMAPVYLAARVLFTDNVNLADHSVEGHVAHPQVVILKRLV